MTFQVIAWVPVAKAMGAVSWSVLPGLLQLFLGVIGLLPVLVVVGSNERRGVIKLAFICACIGFVVGFVVAMELAGWPHQLDRIHIDDTASVMVAAGLLGGGIGWLIGAVGGWFLSRPSIEPSEERAESLGVAVALLVVWAIAAWGWETGFISVSGSPEGVILRTTMMLFATGVTLVAVTLVVLAQRSRFRRAGAVVGAVVAIVILVAAGMRFSSLLPLDRAWLNAWRAGQADVESFAPNALIPASPGCPDVLTIGGRRSFRGGSPWLEGRVPRWLPDDFGLLTWNVYPALGIWADGRCRLVRLMLFIDSSAGQPDSQGSILFPVVDRIGGWDVRMRPCPRDLSVPEGSCLEYRTSWYEGAGEGEGPLQGIRLQMWGIGRDEGDRIALGIPTTDQDQE